MTPATVFSVQRTTIRNFTKKMLTTETDRLVAISGIASHFEEFGAKHGGITYIAGVWKEDLSSLCWKVASEDRGDAQEQDRQYLAPSWSWASVQKPIDSMTRKGFDTPDYGMDNVKCSTDADITKVAILTHPGARLGAVLPGSFITVNAYYLPAGFINPQDPRRPRWLASHIYLGPEEVAVLENETRRQSVLEETRKDRNAWLDEDSAFEGVVKCTAMLLESNLFQKSQNFLLVRQKHKPNTWKCSEQRGMSEHCRMGPYRVRLCWDDWRTF